MRDAGGAGVVSGGAVAACGDVKEDAVLRVCFASPTIFKLFFFFVRLTSRAVEYGEEMTTAGYAQLQNPWCDKRQRKQ